ncbi:hypothetical protein ACFL59_04155 [Planctomycetota bacterium]
MTENNPPERACEFALKQARKLAKRIRAGSEGAGPVVPVEATVEGTDDLPGGRRSFAVQLWSLETDISVELDADSGDMLAWSDPGGFEPGGEPEVSDEEAIEIARSVVDVPPDATLLAVEEDDFGDTPRVIVAWAHKHHDIPVEGDGISVFLNGVTGRVMSVFRKWRDNPGPPPAD